LSDIGEIYVASLSDYNAGRLHGTWIDCDEGADSIWEQINDMLAKSPEASICQWCGNPVKGEHIGHQPMGGIAEEWEIHDYQGWGSIRGIDKHYSIEQLAEMGMALAEHGEFYEVWSADTGETDPKIFEDQRWGEFESASEFGQQWFDGVYDSSAYSELYNYVDWESYGEGLLSSYGHAWGEGNRTLYVWHPG